MSTLYELTQDFREVLMKAEDPEVDEQAVIDTLDAIKLEIRDKADGYAKVMTELDAKETAIEKQIKRLEEMKNTISRKKQRMSDHLRDALIESGDTKFETDLFSFSVVNVGGKLPVIYRTPPAELPEQFRKETITYKPDDAVIRAYLDNGNTSDYFAYGERGQKLRIK